MLSFTANRLKILAWNFDKTIINLQLNNFHTSTKFHNTFFQNLSATQLWKGVISVSNAGKKRGRGKGKNRRVLRDLNRGQVIGLGPQNMAWPGLTSPLMREGKEIAHIQELPPDPERQKRLNEMRDKMFRFKAIKPAPEERGWSGGHMGGRKLGLPEGAIKYLAKQQTYLREQMALESTNKEQQSQTTSGDIKKMSSPTDNFLTNEQQSSLQSISLENMPEREKEKYLATFENKPRNIRELFWGLNFDSRIIRLRINCRMTGNMGRKRYFNCIVITGNHHGLIGWAEANSQEARSALRIAKNRAFKNLVYIERYDQRTIYHTLYGGMGKTKVFMFKRAPGHGLVCHRVIKSICECAGIKDLYARVEGSMKNYLNITSAVISMLAQQETYQQLANRTGQYVVEFKPECENLPWILAAPNQESLQLLEAQNKANEESELSNVNNFNKDGFLFGNSEIVIPKRPVCKRPPQQEPELPAEYMGEMDKYDFETMYTEGGKLYLNKNWFERKKRGFVNLPGYDRYMRYKHRNRNMEEARLRMRVEWEITGKPPHPLTPEDVQIIRDRRMGKQQNADAEE